MSETSEQIKGRATPEPSNAKKSPDPSDPGTEGCTPSFLNREKNEMDKVCGVVSPDPKEEYVQKDEEKEAGGEA